MSWSRRRGAARQIRRAATRGLPAERGCQRHCLWRVLLLVGTPLTLGSGDCSAGSAALPLACLLVARNPPTTLLPLARLPLSATTSRRDSVGRVALSGACVLMSCGTCRCSKIGGQRRRRGRHIPCPTWQPARPPEPAAEPNGCRGAATAAGPPRPPGRRAGRFWSLGGRRNAIGPRAPSTEGGGSGEAGDGGYITQPPFASSSASSSPPSSRGWRKEG